MAKFKVGDIVNIKRRRLSAVARFDNEIIGLEIKSDPDSDGDYKVYTKDKSSWHFLDDSEMDLDIDPNDMCGGEQ